LEVGLTGWWRTALRIGPRFFSIVRRLRPTFHLAGADAIDADFVVENQIRGLIWDVDGTLMGHHRSGLDPSLTSTVGALFELESVRHAIVSNCEEDRYRELCGIFPRIPILIGYETPEGPVFRVRRGEEETLDRAEGDEAVAGLDPAWRLLRKPSGELVQRAMQALGRLPERDVLMVGDQYFTDIASANLAGIRSAKVPPLDPASFPLTVRLGHRIEPLLYRVFYGAPR
jgi:predicted HAD superfamily phosphohydrolase YqeG